MFKKSEKVTYFLKYLRQSYKNLYKVTGHSNPIHHILSEPQLPQGRHTRSQKKILNVSFKWLCTQIFEFVLFQYEYCIKCDTEVYNHLQVSRDYQEFYHFSIYISTYHLIYTGFEPYWSAVVNQIGNQWLCSVSQYLIIILLLLCG